MNNLKYIDVKNIPSTIVRNKKRYYISRDKPFINKNLIKNYILYVDGYIGGGVRFFSDCIINYYRNFTNFIIVRKWEHQLIVTYNDKYRVQFNNYQEIIDFIDNRTIKIFINHNCNHNITFINNLCKSSKETSIISHDHHFIYKACNITDINKIKKEDIIDITKYNKIFTQNINNITYLKKIIPETMLDKFVVGELPDYKNKLEKIEFKNSKIKIGIIGMIDSSIKGIDILKLLFNKYKDKYEFFIFGGMISNKKIPQKSYHNIFDFNELLKQVKPNLFLSISTGPETYSYTTTLVNITDLPVLFYNNTTNNPVVKDRLLKYKESKFREFNLDNLNQFEKDLNEIKQDYLYTIEPKIYFNKIWNDYFLI